MIGASSVEHHHDPSQDRLAGRVGGRPTRPARSRRRRPPRTVTASTPSGASCRWSRSPRTTRFEGPDGTRVAARPVRRSPAADRVPLHVPPGLGGRLPELHGRHRRALARASSSTCTRGTRATRWCRGRRSRSSSAGRRSAGWDHPLVLHQRRRLQLRLRRHHRRVTRLRRVQLPHARRVRRHGRGEHAGLGAALRHAGRTCFLQVDGRVFRTYSVSTPGASRAPAARTTSSTSPRSAARRTGRSPRAAPSPSAATTPTSTS